MNDESSKSGESAAQWVDVGELTPWAENPRRNDKAVAKVAASIRRFGFASPIIARRADGMVIAGHTRLKAAIEMGLDRVPVRYLDLDPADAKMLAIADNRVAEEAKWDGAALSSLLAELDGEGFDLGPLGFGSGELTRLIEAVTFDGDFDDADVGEMGDLEYRVMVECTSEDEQGRAIELLVEGGFECRALIS